MFQTDFIVSPHDDDFLLPCRGINVRPGIRSLDCERGSVPPRKRTVIFNRVEVVKREAITKISNPDGETPASCRSVCLELV